MKEIKSASVGGQAEGRDEGRRNAAAARTNGIDVGGDKADASGESAPPAEDIGYTDHVRRRRHQARWPRWLPAGTRPCGEGTYSETEYSQQAKSNDGGLNNIAIREWNN